MLTRNLLLLGVGFAALGAALPVENLKGVHLAPRDGAAVLQPRAPASSDVLERENQVARPASPDVLEKLRRDEFGPLTSPNVLEKKSEARRLASSEYVARENGALRPASPDVLEKLKRKEVERPASPDVLE
ncbi:MAG: hypothetical protein ASARMPREDX12_008313 [Alectoria sarmentosa]|nr:MAG: hypothetical protein ASARMPREDX12_008313 [Alectoria sarmentosa]